MSLKLEDIFDLSATSLPAAFDIVWCFYPYDKDSKEPGPDARPCIVRSVFTKDTRIQGETHSVGYVKVVYGTKWVDKFDPPQGFHVEDQAEKEACGLRVDTVFDLADDIILPWSPVYFSTKNKTPISGRLDMAMQARLIGQFKALNAKSA